MSAGAKRLTPLTPIAPLLSALPPAPLEAVVQRLATRLSARHPEMLERTADVGAARLLLVATDLPWQALVTLRADGAEVRLLRKAGAPIPAADATVRGPVDRLVACAEGGGDGDAMFFSREIEVDGDTDVLVALRNALDGAELDLSGELAALTGPLRRPAMAAASRMAALYRHLDSGLEALRADVRAPLEARLAAQTEDLHALRQDVQRLRRRQPARAEEAAATGRREARA